jgi:hypothetical protein
VEWKDGLCHECLITKECVPLRADLVRLYHKRERVLKRFGLPVKQEEGKPLQYNPSHHTKNLDEQAARVRTRIVKTVQKYTTDPKRVEELVNKQGALAREAALTHSRIHVPIFGTP